MNISDEMSAVNVAAGMIDELKESNRSVTNFLHKAQDDIKFLERQLVEKDKLIKILEERLRLGKNEFLEASLRQKEFTVKHLEMQIQKLIRENRELELEITSMEPEVCVNCKRKITAEIRDNKKHSTSIAVPKFSTTKYALAKKSTVSHCDDRQKMLERIVEHKDKRIVHLSAEVHRLTATEKDLRSKIDRLTRLLPNSRLPSETMTECLLKEIQLLEAQVQSYKDAYDKLMGKDDSNNININGEISTPMVRNFCPRDKSVTFDRDKNKSLVSEKYERYLVNQMTKPAAETELKQENETLQSCLKKLYHDICDLKFSLVSENEKMRAEITGTMLKNNLLRIRWEEVIQKLNDIIRNIESYSKNNQNLDTNMISDIQRDSLDLNQQYVVLQLQERLSESLELVSSYEKENNALKEDVSRLRNEILEREERYKKITDELKILEERSSTENKSPVHSDDIEILHDTVSQKEKHLQAAQTRLKTCENVIDHLQKVIKENENEKTKLHLASSAIDKERHYVESQEQQVALLQKKLEVSEKHIKTCGDVIEELQKTIRNLENENIKLQSDLREAGSERLLSEVNLHQRASLERKLNLAESQIKMLESVTEQLKDTAAAKDEENMKLKSDLCTAETGNTILRRNEQQVSTLEAKLESAEKQIKTCESSIEKLQDLIRTLEAEKVQLQANLQISECKNLMQETQTDDIVLLKTQLASKDSENENLKKSLHALESKALEINHYRKLLHQEIEKLCEALMDNTEAETKLSCRKAIYKAAILRSAKALLRLDPDFNLQIENVEQSSALEEMKHQVEVYLIEVARIHELFTIKEKQRDELLNEYLGVNGESAPLNNLGATSVHSIHYEENEIEDNLEPIQISDVSLESVRPVGSDFSPDPKSHDENIEIKLIELQNELKHVKAELKSSKTLASYLMSQCNKLDEILSKERLEHAKSTSELEPLRERIKELQLQLNSRNSLAKKLNNLIETMRCKECNDEIAMNQLKDEIKWLMEENQKTFSKIASTQQELLNYKQKNSQIQNDVDNLRRQLVNEKYEHEKVNNELKCLRQKLVDSQISITSDT